MCLLRSLKGRRVGSNQLRFPGIDKMRARTGKLADAHRRTLVIPLIEIFYQSNELSLLIDFRGCIHA